MPVKECQDLCLLIFIYTTDSAKKYIFGLDMHACRISIIQHNACQYISS